MLAPFADRKVDEAAFGSLIRQIAEDTSGFALRNLGKKPMFSHEEYKRVVEMAIETAYGRVDAHPRASTDTRQSYFRIMEESAKEVSVSRTPGISAMRCQICVMRSALEDSTLTRRSKSPVITSQATTSGIFRSA